MRESSSALRVATLTPPGMGAMAVLRISGAEALGVLGAIFEPHRGRMPERPHPQRLIYGRFADGNETIDTGIVAVAEDGIGGHIIELTVHGGVRIVERIVMLIQRFGAVIGTYDPTDSSRESVIESETQACLARAKTKRAVRFLARQRTALPVALGSIAEMCEMYPSRGRTMLANLLERSQPVRYLLEGATIAVMGPANAGKSTLVNRMFAQSQSLTSAREGTTRDWVDTWGAIEGVPVRVIDTAGLRPGAQGLERQAIDRGLEQGSQADLRIVVVDGSRAFPSAFFERYRSIIDGGRAVLAVNKSDLPMVWEPAGAAGTGLPAVTTSGLTGRGMTELAQLVLTDLSIATLEERRAFLFTTRQMDWISKLLSGDIDPCCSEAIRSQLTSCVAYGRRKRADGRV